MFRMEQPMDIAEQFGEHVQQPRDHVNMPREDADEFMLEMRVKNNDAFSDVSEFAVTEEEAESHIEDLPDDAPVGVAETGQSKIT